MKSTPNPTPDELAHFFGRPAPRRIPRAIWRSAARRQPFRGVMWLGAILVIAGLGTAALFQLWLLPAELCLDWGWGSRAEGRIAGWEQSRYSIDGDDERAGTPLYRVRFRFTPAGGAETQAAGYVTGRENLPGLKRPSGDRSHETAALDESLPIEVEYLPWRPAWARAEGTRLAPFGYYMILVLAFAVAGGVLIRRGWRARNALARLLAEGMLAPGRVAALHPTGAVINGRPAFEARVAFTDASGMARTAGCRVLGAAADRCQAWRDDGSSVGVLHLPDRFDEAYIVDLLLSD